MLSALACLAVLPGGDLLVVDSTGGGDFTEIQAAVDAALDGDTILVHPRLPGPPGEYAAFEVVGKGVTILGAGETAPEIDWFAVRDLGPDQTVVLHNLYRSANGTDGVFNEITDCVGSVRLSRMRMAWPVQVTACSDVVVHESNIGGSTQVFGSQIAVYDTRVLGWGLPGGKEGDVGLELFGSIAWLSGAYVEGGGAAESCSTGTCYKGGDGLVLHDSSAVWVTSDSEFHGGEGSPCGGGLGCYNEWGPWGEDVVVDASSDLVWVDQPRPSVETSRLGRAEGVPLLEIRGTPGDRVFLRCSSETRWLLKPAWHGVAHVAPPVPGERPVRVNLGRMPWRGSMVVEVPPKAWNLVGAPGTVHLQPEVRTADGAFVLGDAHLVTRLPEDPEDLGGPCPARLYVDADAAPGGDGLSWDTALRDLGEALELVDDAYWCQGRTDVWVAEGKYRPQPPGGHPGIAFEVRGPVRIFGGFAGDEQSLDERDWQAHPTILSGDLNGDDLPGFQNRTDNSDTLLRIDDCCRYWWLQRGFSRLDGLVLEGASGDSGAALDLESTVVAKCTLRDNDGVYAVRIDEGLLGSSRIEGNGGGASVLHGDVLDSVFVENQGLTAGALAIGSWLRPVQVSGSVFLGNRGSSWPAVNLQAPGRAAVQGNTFYANQAAEADGSSLRARAHTYVPVSQVRFTGNVFWANTAAGGSDETTQLRWEPDVLPTLTHNCIEHLSNYVGNGNHSLDPTFVDPAGPDGIPGTADDDLRLGPGSPCVDAGHNAWRAVDLLDGDGDGDRVEPTPFDVAGEARSVDDPDVVDTGKGRPPLVDMGAHERQD